MNPPSPKKVSIVICTYNRSDMLRATLESVGRIAAPGELRWDLLIVDNNSSDQTKEVVESFIRTSAANARYVFEPNSGLSHARNRGINETDGEIVSFLDDDVIVAPDWLAEVVKAFEKYGAMCVSGRVLLHGNPEMPSWWDSSFDVAIGKFDRGTNEIQYAKDDEGLIGIGANMSFRRSVFAKYGLFNTEMGRIGNKQRTGEETELTLKLRKNDDLAVYYPHAVVFHCIPSDRFSKGYLRQNAYHFGTWRFLSDSEGPQLGLKLRGAPVWRYRAVVQAAVLECFHKLLRRPEKAFMEERKLLVHVGYLVAAWKSRSQAKVSLGGADRGPTQSET